MAHSMTERGTSGHGNGMPAVDMAVKSPSPSLAPATVSLAPPSDPGSSPSLPSLPSLDDVAARSVSLAPSVETRARDRVFREMYEAQVAFVWRNLRRLGVSDAEADDKAQEVFVIAYRRFVDFEERGHGPRAWLFQIVLRVASDARRHKRRHPEDPDGGDALEREAVEAPQQADLARREALGTLDRALATIDVGRRAVLVLHEIEEMTAPEIAEVLEIPLNTVYSRLRVARMELEAALAKTKGGGAR